MNHKPTPITDKNTYDGNKLTPASLNSASVKLTQMKMPRRYDPPNFRIASATFVAALRREVGELGSAIGGEYGLSVIQILSDNE